MSDHMIQKADDQIEAGICEKENLFLKIDRCLELLNQCETFLHAVNNAFFWLPPGKKRDLSYNSKATELLKKIRIEKELR